MSATARDLERITDLLADESVSGLDMLAEQELAGLLRRAPVVRRDQFMEAAALAQVACLRRAGGATPMPAALRARLTREGEAALRGLRSPAVAPAPVAAPAPVVPLTPPEKPRAATPPRRFTGLLGWALAAALAVAFVVVRPVAGPADPVDGRSALLAEADTVTLPWSPPTVPGYEQVTGDVVWSPSRQQGYLRLAGLPVNDPARAQYQLWIVDPERDSHPVDGGVFDVSSRGEVVIPIQAKLRILNPKAFAITREKPGGVVVSAGPLLVVAGA